MVDGLDAGVLRRLYLDEDRTETQIAEMFGTYQVKVGRLRRKWGIPTRTKTERVSGVLPNPTSQQAGILVGSLLGDGWMRATSDLAAGFGEGHCLKQRAYTDWKADIMEPFTSSRHSGVKVDHQTGRTFHSWSFSTTCCSQLRPFYDAFYPPPSRKRMFPSNLPDLMTPFILAVWYMDDGNLGTGSHPRIAFGLDDLSLKRGLSALRALGLKPKVYGEGSNRAIHFPKQRMKFRALIEPHVIPCMAYKIPSETERMRGDRNARDLTAPKAKTLYDGGMSVAQISKAFGVGDSTVKRRLQAAGTTMRKSGPKKNGHQVESASILLSAPEPLSADDVFRVLRGTPFPVAPPYNHDDALKAFQKVRYAPMNTDGGLVGPVRSVGSACCSSFFPNRYSARSRWSKHSAFEAWHDEKELRKAIRFQLKVGDPVVPARVLKAITMNCRTPSVFRPTVARLIYETFCKPGDRVWDPCSGYGGRLMGAAAVGVQYVGTDVELATVEGNRRLAEALGYSCEMHCIPAQDFVPPPVQLVFTSPPYFDQEQYAGGQQSWRDFETFGAWVEGFLRPLVRKAASALTEGGHLILNVADIRNRKGGVFPLVARTQEVALEEGFHLEARWEMKLPNLNRKKTEPILVFGLDNQQATSRMGGSSPSETG